MNALNKALGISLSILASAGIVVPAWAADLVACSDAAGTPTAERARPFGTGITPDSIKPWPSTADCTAYGVSCWTGPSNNWLNGTTYVAGEMAWCGSSRQVRVYAYGNLQVFANNHPGYPNRFAAIYALNSTGGSAGGTSVWNSLQAWSSWVNVNANVVKTRVEARVFQ